MATASTAARGCIGRAPATGAPVLLIMGLGLSGGAWWRTVPVLARRLRVITFDNRGVGRSARSATPTRPRRWPTTPSSCSTRRESSARTSTASRWAAWSRSSSRCATPSGCARSCSARRTPGGPRACGRRRRASRSSAAGAHGAEEAARASVASTTARAAARARRPHRGGHRAAARAPVQRAGLPRAAVRGRAAQLLRPAAAHRGADARRPRSPRPHDPGRERAAHRRAHPRRRLRILEESGHLYTTEEPRPTTRSGAFFAAARRGGLGLADDARR